MQGLKSGGTAVLAVFLAAAWGGAGTSPRHATEKFYRVYLERREGGVPTGARLAAFREVISADLFSLLERAGAAAKAYARETRGESPPLVEGDLFTSLFEGATRYRVEECRSVRASATCRVALAYEERGAKPVEWTDTITLVRGDSGWRVSDVEFGGTWEFMHAGRLVGLLESVIAESQGP